jgi:exopolysaccharide biosynthesis polyprenyl glycosylphosphotransferase
MNGVDIDPIRVTSRPTIAPAKVKRVLMLADLLAVLVGASLAMGLQALLRPQSREIASTEWLLVIGSLPLWLLAARASHLYVSRANLRVADELKHILWTAVLGVAAAIGLAFVFQVDDLSRWWTATLLGSVFFALSAERLFARVVFRRLRRDGRLSRPILVVGMDEHAVAIARTTQRHPELGYRTLGFIADHPPTQDCDLPVLGRTDRIEQVARSVGASGVLISLQSTSGEVVNALSRRLTDAGLHVTLGTGLRDIDLHRLRAQELDGQALFYIEPIIRTGWRRTAMRVFDVGVSMGALLFAAPLIAASAIAIRLESDGPVFFRQRRIGQGGSPFDIIKLRTMHDGADDLKDALLALNESDGPLFKISADPRVTRVGRFLRKFSIDELPQFWNVLRGEMSVVGPRPALPREVAEWDEDVHERLRVLPGITGMWQISGRSETTFDEYKRLDMYYVDNWSLRHDVKIVLRTIAVVLRGRGAS